MKPFVKKINLLFFLLSLSFFGHAQSYNMSNTTITDCSGLFNDSGGNNGSYGANENLTTVICPDMTSGTHIQLVFSGTEIDENDMLCFFDGPNASAPALACQTDFTPGAPFIIQATAENTSGCLTITFTSDSSTQYAGWSADINCVAECQSIIADIAMSTPPIVPVDTGYIDICPGERIFLTGQGMYPQNGAVYEHSDLTSTFEWDWGDGNFSVGPSVTHVYEEPGGYIIQLKITDVQDCSNTNFITQRVRVSPYPIFSNISSLPTQICSGDTITLTSSISNNSGETYTVVADPGMGSFQTEQTRSDSLALPDGTGVTYETSVSFTDFPPGAVLTDVNDILGICVVMEHSYLRDLEIKLRCPDGTEITMLEQLQSGGEVFLGIPYEQDETGPPVQGTGYEYCWTADPANPTWLEYCNSNPNVGTLPEGNYSPFESFDAFLGCPLNGEWTISVQDLWGIDNGFIFEWGIEFDADLYQSIETFSPVFTDWGWQNNDDIFYYSEDSIASSPIDPGVAIYTFETTNDFGCQFDTTFTVDVLSSIHSTCYTCPVMIEEEPDQSICLGDILNLNVGTNEVEDEVIKFSTSPNYAVGKPNHPPANPYFSALAVDVISPAMITDATTDILSVCVNFETDWLSDIQIALVSPNGIELDLTTNNGGSSDFYTNTCFTPSATENITDGVTPFSGNYQPEGDWSALNGEPVNGDWKLKVSDANGNQFGILKSWAITFFSPANLTYTWTPALGLSCGDCSTPTANLSQSQEFIIDATNSRGCSEKDTLYINVVSEIPAPAINCSSDYTVGTITLDLTPVNNNATYEINVGNGWEAVTGTQWQGSGFVPGDVLNYDIRTVGETSGCPPEIFSSSCTMTIECDMYIETADGSTTGQADCNGSCDYTVSLSAYDAVSSVAYSAINTTTGATVPHNNPSSGLFTGLCPGAYTFTAVDAFGCSDNFDFTITEPSPVSLSVPTQTDADCFGQNTGSATVMATGGTAPYTYLWNDTNNQTTANATFLAAGAYTVTVNDANNCLETFDVFINEPTALTVSSQITDVLCHGENTGSIAVTAQGGTAPYTYNWQDVPDGNNLTAGNYTVTVLDANQCETVLTETVNEPATALSASINQTFVSCFETNDGRAEVMPMGGTSTYTYIWDNGNTTAEATNLTDDTHSVTITDANQCEVVQSIEIQQLDELIPNLSVTPVSCTGSSTGGAAINNIMGGASSGNPDSGEYTYLWSNNETTGAITNQPEGSVSVQVTDDQGCIGFASGIISGTESIEILYEAESARCYGEASGSITVTDVLNAFGTLEYTWNNNETTATISNLAAGSYDVTVTDDINCIATTTIEITEPDSLKIEFDVEDNPCPDDLEGSINATITGGVSPYNILWQDGQDTTSLTSLYSDVWDVTVTDANQCQKIDSVAVNQPIPIAANLIITDAACAGLNNGAITIETTGGTPPFLYSTDGEGFNGSNTQIGLAAGDYEVFIQDANGCTQSFNTTVNEPLPLEMFIATGTGASLYDGDDYTIQLGDSLDLYPNVINNQGNAAIDWNSIYVDTTLVYLNTDSTDIRTKPFNSIFYTIQVIDEEGCTEEIQIQIRVAKEHIVVVPTGFSPNNAGDPANEMLRVHGQDKIVINYFIIYDRWGEKVYEATNFPVNSDMIGWDGTFRGKEMPAGQYVWYLEAKFIDNTTQIYKGSTTLLR